MNPLVEFELCWSRFRVLPGLVAGRGLVALLLLSGCATNPVTGDKQFNMYTTGQEIQLGGKNYLPYQQMEGGAFETMPELTEYVRTVGHKLVKVSDRPSLPYDFVVLNNGVPNAWALPGGKIAVNRGLLTELNSEAELAAVLGHEIVHAAGSHTANAMSKGVLLQTTVMGLGAALSENDYAEVIMAGAGLTAGLASTKFSRDNERESDLHGMKYMKRAGYDTQAAVDLQETFVRIAQKEGGGGGGWGEGLFSSHPPSRERVENNRRALQTHPAGGFRGEKEYQAALAPLRKAKPAYDKFDEGQKALQKGDARRALTLAREAQALEPKEAHFHGLAAKALARQKDYNGALAEADQAVKLNPNFFEFLLLRGQLRQKLGVNGGREDLAASHRLLPTAAAAGALGKLALREGDRRGAALYLEQAAASQTPEGREAGAALARLQLGEAPERFLRTGASLNTRGELVVQVANHASAPVRGVVVTVWDAAGRTTEQIRIPGVIPPGRVASAPTRIGPFASVEQARRLRMQVAAAEVAGP